ncbi:hypothetical protein DUI87_22868 [Hirundo rustica rustica]|uniref:Uncharacterized protein n=1 Tax=Hirundo rustica rustica TaxID=333673 RepID=A0A3M0JIV7_HIRRU|nr:hypothetical protein DUI87_22868 [Hirundo rustica rustica]
MDGVAWETRMEPLICEIQSNLKPHEEKQGSLLYSALPSPTVPVRLVPFFQTFVLRFDEKERRGIFAGGVLLANAVPLEISGWRDSDETGVAGAQIPVLICGKVIHFGLGSTDVASSFLDLKSLLCFWQILKGAWKFLTLPITSVESIDMLIVQEVIGRLGNSIAVLHAVYDHFFQNHWLKVLTLDKSWQVCRYELEIVHCHRDTVHGLQNLKKNDFIRLAATTPGALGPVWAMEGYKDDLGTGTSL